MKVWLEVAGLVGLRGVTEKTDICSIQRDFNPQKDDIFKPSIFMLLRSKVEASPTYLMDLGERSIDWLAIMQLES